MARAWAVVLAIVAAGLVAAVPGAPTARTYRIVPGHGKIEVYVKTEGLVNPSRGLILEAKDYSGKIVYDPLRPQASTVELRIPVRRLEPTAPTMTREEHDDLIVWLRSSWVLDMRRFSEIAFFGSGAHLGGARGSGFRAITVPGRLQIHGYMHEAKLQAIARIATDGIMIMGRHFVRQREHGMVPLKDATGVYTIRNEVEIVFNLFAVPETELALHPDEVQPPEWKERAEKSGEMLPGAPAPDRPLEDDEVKPPSLEPRTEKSGEWTDPKVDPDKIGDE